MGRAKKGVMFQVILIALAGVAAGYLLRRVRALQHVHHSITLTICFMLFVLGLSVGADPNIVSNLLGYGGQALLISVAGMAGSVVAAWALHRYVFKNMGEEEKR